MTSKPIDIFIRRVCIGNKVAECRSLPHSPNKKQHWGKKYRWAEAWKEQVYWSIREKIRVVKPFKYAKIEIQLYTTHPQDKDNSYASIKPVLDGAKGIVIEDDNPDKLDLKVRTIKVDKKEKQGVRMLISEWKKDNG